MQKSLDLQGGQNAVEGGAGDSADAHIPHTADRDFGQIACGIVKFQPDALRPQGQRPAQGGQPDAAPGAFVDRGADDPLDLGNQAGGCGLRDAKDRGRLGQVFGVGQGCEQAQMAEFEAAAQQGI